MTRSRSATRLGTCNHNAWGVHKRTGTRLASSRLVIRQLAQDSFVRRVGGAHIVYSPTSTQPSLCRDSQNKRSRSCKHLRRISFAAHACCPRSQESRLADAAVQYWMQLMRGSKCSRVTRIVVARPLDVDCAWLSGKVRPENIFERGTIFAAAHVLALPQHRVSILTNNDQTI